jgi:uncharacterized protein (TIGR02466 family)
MQILPLYATPIYHGDARQSKFNIIQDEFKVVFDSLVADGTFQKKESNQHQVSNTNFNSNLIKECNLKTFEQELLFHVNQYMSMIGRDPVRNTFEVVESWMTLTNKGEFTPQHEHGFNDISGVYYFNVKENDEPIYFSSPVKQCKSSRLFAYTHPELSIPPKNGLFVLFPGWLEHGVSPQRTDGDRISVSFNIHVPRPVNTTPTF